MTIFLHDTMTKAKQEFIPINRQKVRMYVCGPTVYDLIHIGNARALVVFDVLYRLLRHKYGETHVTYVRNITDVDDKINASAHARGIAIAELTAQTITDFHQDADRLGLLKPNIEPCATAHIGEMITVISNLITSGNAYVGKGHVYFAVKSFADYGRLSGRAPNDMVAGARIEIGADKRDPLDFVLWKPSKSHEPGWQSPWGRGRPGWHIECTAMSNAYFGHSFDIHGGGADLIFPHHENEIAQSRCGFNTKTMANYWLHNGLVQVENDKMSKSFGNTIILRKLLEKWPGEVVRMAFMLSHYRKPLNWTKHILPEAHKILAGWFKAVDGCAPASSPDSQVIAALADDLNTPKAITRIHELRHDISKGNERAAGKLLASARLMGLMVMSGEQWREYWRQSRFKQVSVSEIERLIGERASQRNAGNFAKSDEIRDRLRGMGVALKDEASKTTWEFI